jgi:hypothetical protein
MVNVLKTSIFCNNTESKRVLKFEESLADSQIIGTAISDIFRYDNLYRKTSSKIIWYNKPIYLKIESNQKLLIDTRDSKYKIFEMLFCFRGSSKSKRDFARIIWYLYEVNNFDCKIEYNENQEFKEISDLVSVDKTSNDISRFEFNDTQIAILCSGMKSVQARKLGEEFFKMNGFSESQKEQALNYVNTAREKYGQNILDYCLKLPKKPFVITNAKRVFTQFDGIKKSPKGVVRIVNQDIDLELSYSKVKDLIEINNKDRTCLAKFKRSGELHFLKKPKKPISSLVLFLSYIDDPIRQILYYGSQTGNCSFCNLRLSDPISLQYGYGKQCALNYKLPWG